MSERVEKWSESLGQVSRCLTKEIRSRPDVQMLCIPNILVVKRVLRREHCATRVRHEHFWPDEALAARDPSAADRLSARRPGAKSKERKLAIGGLMIPGDCVGRA
jgi:hypothetical protein